MEPHNVRNKELVGKKGSSVISFPIVVVYRMYILKENAKRTGSDRIHDKGSLYYFTRWFKELQSLVFNKDFAHIVSLRRSNVELRVTLRTMCYCYYVFR